MNDFHSASDAASDPPASDPLADALRRLQPARCEIDTEPLFYRSGYAAAVAERRRGLPPWALAASLLLVAGLAGAAGFTIGDSAAVGRLALDTRTGTSKPESPPGARPADPPGRQPPRTASEADGAASPTALPAAEPPQAADVPPQVALATSASLPVWSRWLGWQQSDAGRPRSPDDRLTIRPTHDQWQQLIGLNVPAARSGEAIPPAAADILDDDPRLMLSSAATEAALQSLTH